MSEDRGERKRLGAAMVAGHHPQVADGQRRQGTPKERKRWDTRGILDSGKNDHVTESASK